jgi:hypothetical protein
MRLKVFVTGCVIAEFLLFLTAPLILGDKPGDEATKKEKANYGVKMLSLFGGAGIICVMAAGGAVILMRRTKQEYLEEQAENLKELVEGSLKDHAEKQKKMKGDD